MGNGELLLNGYSVSVLQDESSSCILLNNVNALNTTELCVHLKMVEMINFVMDILRNSLNFQSIQYLLE